MAPNTLTVVPSFPFAEEKASVEKLIVSVGKHSIGFKYKTRL